MSTSRGCGHAPPVRPSSSTNADATADNASSRRTISTGPGLVTNRSSYRCNIGRIAVTVPTDPSSTRRRNTHDDAPVSAARSPTEANARPSLSNNAGPGNGAASSPTRTDNTPPSETTSASTPNDPARSATSPANPDESAATTDQPSPPAAAPTSRPSSTSRRTRSEPDRYPAGTRRRSPEPTPNAASRSFASNNTTRRDHRSPTCTDTGCPARHNRATSAADRTPTAADRDPPDVPRVDSHNPNANPPTSGRSATATGDQSNTSRSRARGPEPPNVTSTATPNDPNAFATSSAARATNTNPTRPPASRSPTASTTP